jgi:hypothetical protein
MSLHAREVTIFSSSELDRVVTVPRTTSLFLCYFGDDKTVRRDSVDTARQSKSDYDRVNLCLWEVGISNVKTTSLTHTGYPFNFTRPHSLLHRLTHAFNHSTEN